MLKAGADKVAVNSAAIFNPGLINELSRTFGSQCIVIAIDAKLVSNDPAKMGNIYPWWGAKPTGIDAIEWAIKMTQGDAGAGEILLTSMDRDGTKDGFDIPLTRAISDAVLCPCNCIWRRWQVVAFIRRSDRWRRRRGSSSKYFSFW